MLLEAMPAAPAAKYKPCCLSGNRTKCILWGCFYSRIFRVNSFSNPLNTKIQQSMSKNIGCEENRFLKLIAFPHFSSKSLQRVGGSGLGKDLEEPS